MKWNPPLKYLFVLTILCTAFTVDMRAQSYKTGYTTISFIDSGRSNKRIRARIFYPAVESGKNTPLPELAEGKFPVISFGHGYRLSANTYGNICRTLVPEGFIVAFPLTERGIFPSHTALGEDIAFVVQQLKKAGEAGNSMFSGRIADKTCFMGHSMGGGAALLGAVSGVTPDAIALLAPFETNPSAVTAAGKVSVPALIFAGGNDCITPPGENQEPVYFALKSIDKTYISIIGGSHCQMADNNWLCRLAETTCRPEPTITREEQHAIISRYLVPWLKSVLKGEEEEGNKVAGSLKNDRSVNHQITRNQ